MLVSLRSTIIELGLGKNSSFLAESALETHCFLLGGNEFRLRVYVCDAKRMYALFVGDVVRVKRLCVKIFRRDIKKY